jgi:hypothetical protein
MKEIDLYKPIQDYLIQNGYTVRSEVKHCDITAIRGNDLIIIELKRNLSIDLLLQATQRLKITESVYVAVPTPNEGPYSKRWRKIQQLLRRLELGLILVSPKKSIDKVKILFHPTPYTKKTYKKSKRAVLQEIENRVFDENQGGSVGRKLMTAYRESAIQIACCLEHFGPMSPKELRKLGTCTKTQSILYNNHYGWFERIDTGMYRLKDSAMKEIFAFTDTANHYKEWVQSIRIK